MSSVLNVVCNNYLTTYTPKALTRYDTHKRSELRSVYNSIVKMNTDTPWYLPITNKATQRYAVDIKENARELKNTIAQLGGLEENGLFSKKSAYSTDEQLVTASYIGPQKTAADVPSLELEVRSLAASQENLGSFLPEGRAALQTGTYSFDVSVGDMNYEFQFSVGESETNREIQDRLARLINNSGIGVRAEVAESDAGTALRLTSEGSGRGPGKARSFRVSDAHTSKTSGTVEYFGLNKTSRAASDASFAVNGRLQSSPDNHVTLDKTFDILLKGVTPKDKPVRIGLKTDVESLADNVSHLIGGYNDFIKAASTYLDSQTKSRQLVSEMKGIAASYTSSMEPMGFTLKEDGTLNVDKELLHQTAARSNDVSESFGYLKSFSNMLLRKSEQISLNPMNYVQRIIVAYKNPGHNFIVPYATSAYSGMMFDGYC
ncbi:MAG: hypothetical protein K2O06_02880 [Acetatifactor sp.]|nr:hypothetical protein [Acetatifactor sp.]